MSKRKGKMAHSETAVLDRGHDTDDENLREDSVDHESDAEDNETISVSMAGLESDEDEDETDEVETEDSNEDDGVETEPTNQDSVYARFLVCAREYDPNFQPKSATESLTAFVKRLVPALYGAPEAAWNAMGEDAQVVYNALAKSQGRPPEIPGLVPDAPITRLPPAVRTARPKSVEELAEREAARAQRKARAEAKRQAKLAAKEAKGPSKVRQVREYLLANLPNELPLEKIIEDMGAKGIHLQKTTMQTLRHEMYAVVSIMRDVGVLREGA